MPCNSYLASLVNHNVIPIDFRVYELIWLSLTSMKMITNIFIGDNYVLNEHAYMYVGQYGPYVMPSEIMFRYNYLQVWWIKMKSLFCYCVNKLIWH